MSVKTITVTESAYSALKSMKEPGESFSETILRVAKRRPLSDFYGILRGESGERFEKAVWEARRRHEEDHRVRRERVVRELKE
ncbi:MAG: antitoxin VapB family protein [Euryarchaeota archaeon]|nr:antitoxin VapB family protein [Euryarchaeota archaeon]